MNKMDSFCCYVFTQSGSFCVWCHLVVKKKCQKILSIKLTYRISVQRWAQLRCPLHNYSNCNRWEWVVETKKIDPHYMVMCQGTIQPSCGAQVAGKMLYWRKKLLCCDGNIWTRINFSRIVELQLFIQGWFFLSQNILNRCLFTSVSHGRIQWKSHNQPQEFSHVHSKANWLQIRPITTSCPFTGSPSKLSFLFMTFRFCFPLRSFI